MRRRAAKVDESQPGIVKALRAAGASVESTAAVGSGFPDLVVGYRGRNYLMEVKNHKRPGLARHRWKLSGVQPEWHRAWGGQVATVRDPEEALRVIGAIA
jgi:hypothetical protein